MTDAEDGHPIEAIRADLEAARLGRDATRYAEVRAELDRHHTRIIEAHRTTDPVLRAERVAQDRAIVARMVAEWQALR